MKHSFDFTARDKYRRISPELQQARFALVDYAIANPGTFSQASAKQTVAAAMGKQAAALVDDLIEQNLISLDDDEDIAYLYPVSCEETMHRVRLADGREFCAMCAIDALGCAATFGMNAEIFSATKDTEEPVYALVSPSGLKKIEPAGMMVSYYDSWAEGCINY